MKIVLSLMIATVQSAVDSKNTAKDYALCEATKSDTRGNCKSDNAYCCLGIGPEG